MSIKQNLQSSILFLAVIPVILMALLAYFVSLSKYASINEVNITKTASDYSFGFTSQLESQIIETEALADTNNIKSYLLEKVNSPDALLDTNSAAYQSILESIVQLSNNADHSVNYSFYDIDGYLTITTDDDAVSDWAEIMDKTVSEYTTTIVIPKSDFDPNTLDIITPVIVNGNIIGLLRTNIKKEYFGIFISAERGTFLLDKAGKPIFGHKTTKEDKTFLNHIKSLFNSSTNNDTMVKLNDAFSENTDYLYGYATIPTYDWIYVVKQDTSTYTNIVSSLPGIMIILLIAVVIVAAFITRNIVNLYTIPIFQLQEDIRAAASGKLDVHCDVNSDDEFGDLADNFNQMMDIISTNYTELVGAHQKLEDNQIEFALNGRLSPKELVYVASEEDKALTELFETQPEVLEGWGQMIGFHIIYLPLLIKKLKDKRVLQYRAPYLTDLELSEISIGNDFLLQYLENPSDKEKIKQGFIRTEDIHRGNDGKDKAINRFYPLSSKSGEPMATPPNRKANLTRKRTA